MKNENSEEDEDSDSADEECEQLLRANAHLRDQLVSLTSLSASLAQQQAGETLVCFGSGPNKRWLNARSIRMLSLSEGTTLDTEKFQTEGSGTYAVLVDELQVTRHLPADEAEQVLDEVADALNRILQPSQD